MRRDEFLLQAVTFDQAGIAETCEHRLVIASQQKQPSHKAQRAIAVNQSLFKR